MIHINRLFVKLSLLFFILMLSCKSANEEKAQTTIRKYLASTLDDFKSYESGAFSKLDSAYTTIDSMENYRTIKAKIILNSNSLRLDNDSMGLWIRDKQQIEKQFKPEFIGYKTTHKFRTKNAFEVPFFCTYEFYLDKTFSKVLRVKKTAKKL